MHVSPSLGVCGVSPATTKEMMFKAGTKLMCMQTHTHTHVYVYVYVCRIHQDTQDMSVCACVCVHITEDTPRHPRHDATHTSTHTPRGLRPWAIRELHMVQMYTLQSSRADIYMYTED